MSFTIYKILWILFHKREWDYQNWKSSWKYLHIESKYNSQKGTIEDMRMQAMIKSYPVGNKL